MLQIPCPWCGTRDHAEFAYGGDAGIRRPDAGAPLEAFVEYVYVRDNPRGRHLEYWQHLQGCRSWLIVERDVTSHEIHAVRPANRTEGAAE